LRCRINKTARAAYTHNNAYDDIGLNETPDDYLPGAVYGPGNRDGDRSSYFDAIAEWPKPSIPGFWPVADEGELLVWEVLLGERLPALTGSTNLHQGQETPVNSSAYLRPKATSAGYWSG